MLIFSCMYVVNDNSIIILAQNSLYTIRTYANYLNDIHSPVYLCVKFHYTTNEFLTAKISKMVWFKTLDHNNYYTLNVLMNRGVKKQLRN